jgi:hypothetical protein
MRPLLRIAVSYVVAAFVAWLIFPLPYESHGVPRASILVSLVFPVLTLCALFAGGMTVKMWSFVGIFLLLFLPLAWVSVKRRPQKGLPRHASLEKPRSSK